MLLAVPGEDVYCFRCDKLVEYCCVILRNTCSIFNCQFYANSVSINAFIFILLLVATQKIKVIIRINGNNFNTNISCCHYNPSS